jgi:hypothetical protein
MTSKSDNEGWGAAQRQIRAAAHFLLDDKSGLERQEIADELVRSIRAIARGELPPPQTNAFDRDAQELEGWARNVARSMISVAIGACERLGQRPPYPDQTVLLRELAWWALWHMPNAAAEATKLAKTMTMEKLRQPHPGDDPAPEI